MPYGVNPITGRPGPSPKSPISGNKRQARARVNVEVRTGRIPHPNTLPCTDCGHVWKEGDRRHEYDHSKGYGAEFHLIVESVCTLCHAKRDSVKANSTHCKRGHEFTAENTARKKNGNRVCIQCRRIKDKNRGRDADFWRSYRLKRKQNKNG